MSNITLNPTQRQTLESLTQVTSLFNRTQERLNTGKKVNTATDDPVSFFRSQSLSDRATSILGQKANIDQSVQAVNAALDGTSSAATLLNSLQGVLAGARSGSLNQRISATQAFDTLGTQLAQLIKDSSFQGLDLLTSTSVSLATQFSDRTSATLTIQGFNLAATATANARTLFTQAVSFNAAGLVFSQIVANATLSIGVGGFSALDLAGSAGGGGTVAASTALAIFDATASRLATAVTQLQGISAQLGANVAILQARANFSTNYSNTLTSGADALTLADFNTEAANSQALSLRQQLGIQSLSGSAAANSSILNLLK
jgi:flagellin